eukprot:COSAG01_NODE_482_length_16412_cov_47.760130_8_plen_97_part_00
MCAISEEEGQGGRGLRGDGNGCAMEVDGCGLGLHLPKTPTPAAVSQSPRHGSAVSAGIIMKLPRGAVFANMLQARFLAYAPRLSLQVVRAHQASCE